MKVVLKMAPPARLEVDLGGHDTPHIVAPAYEESTLGKHLKASPPNAPARRAIMEVLYPRCGGLDVHQVTVLACVRLPGKGRRTSEVRTFETTTEGLLQLADWGISGQDKDSHLTCL